MDNLNNSNLILRTLSPKEYTQLIDDLNYNFTKILNLPGFKGIRGKSIQGIQGVGVRGSKWIFVQLQDVSIEYGLTDYTQISREWVNGVFKDDPERFFNSLYIPNDINLLLGDVLVLPDGDIITLSETTKPNDEVVIEFVDTGITFNDVTSVSESRVVEIFQDLYSQANTGLGATRHYNAVAKNATDASPQLNTQTNSDSAVDIVTTGAGVGAPLSDYTFVGTSETAVSPTVQMCLLVGSANRYHKLVQATQGNWSNDYVAGVDDFASLIVLQNNNKNGILFGNKNNTDLRKFGRLYNDGGATVLTSSYSPTQSEFSDIVISDTSATIRAIRATINAKTTDILSEKFNSNYLSWDEAQAFFGDGMDKKLWIGFNKGVYLKNTRKAEILSTDDEGKIIKKYSVSSNFDNRSNIDMVTSQAIWEYLEQFSQDLDGVGTINDALDKRIFMTRFEAPIRSGSITISDLVEHGTYSLPKDKKIIDRIGNRQNATLANDGLLTVHRWSDSNTNYEYIIQKLVVRSPMFVPSGGVYQQFVNSSQFTGELAKDIDNVVYRRGHRSLLSNLNAPFTFNTWSWEFNDHTMFDTDEVLQITGDLKNNNLEIKHRKVQAGTSSGLNQADRFDNKVVSDIEVDEWGHVTRKKKIDLSSTYVSRNNGGIGNLPWDLGGQDSVEDIIKDMIRKATQPTTGVITTPQLNTMIGSGSVTISPRTPSNGASSHNLDGHVVKVTFDKVATKQYLLTVTINRIDTSYPIWNANNFVLTSTLPITFVNVSNVGYNIFNDFSTSPIQLGGVSMTGGVSKFQVIINNSILTAFSGALQLTLSKVGTKVGVQGFI